MKPFALLLLCATLVQGQYVRLVFEGDSITEGTGVPAQKDVYASRLTNIWWTCPNIAAFYNVAISGSKISDCDNRYTNNVYPHRPAGGTNAFLFCLFGLNNVIFNDPSPVGAIFTQYSNYCYRARADGFTVVAFNTTSNINAAAGWPRTVDYNNLVRTNWTAFADYFVDVGLLLPDASNEWAYADGLHWSTNGHLIVATNIATRVIDLCDSLIPLPTFPTATLRGNQSTRGNATIR